MEKSATPLPPFTRNIAQKAGYDNTSAEIRALGQGTELRI
jgi:hypothetical protein